MLVVDTTLQQQGIDYHPLMHHSEEINWSILRDRMSNCVLCLSQWPLLFLFPQQLLKADSSNSAQRIQIIDINEFRFPCDSRAHMHQNIPVNTRHWLSAGHGLLLAHRLRRWPVTRVSCDNNTYIAHDENKTLRTVWMQHNPNLLPILLWKPIKTVTVYL